MRTLREFAQLPAGLAIAWLACLATTLSATSRYGNLPLSFEPNRGQAPAEADFLAHGSGYELFLGAGDAVLSLDGHGLRMKLQGARHAPAAMPLGETGGTVNYLIGNDPKQWRIGIPTYSGVKYANVYRGIDVVYYARQRQLEYDFIVSPGAHPEAIRLRFEGAEKVEVDGDGELVVRLPGKADPVRFHKPEIHQGKDRIAGGYW